MNNNDDNNENDNQYNFTEEELRELNLYAEEQKQESMAKYGRNIYDEKGKIGNEKFLKVTKFIDKIFDVFFNIRIYLLFAVLIIILIFVWGNVFAARGIL